MSFAGLLEVSARSYWHNLKMLSFFAFPFALVFPLSVLLPNFVALGGIFLRYGSIRSDLSVLDAAATIAAYLVSLLLFSFALVGINMVIKSQRTLLKLSHYEQEKIEAHTLSLFTVFLFVFVVSLVANLLLYDAGLAGSLGMAVSLALALGMLFVPQAMVLEDLSIGASIKRSLSMLYYKLPYVVFFIAVSAVLLLVVSYVSLQFPGFRQARYFAVLVNAVVLLPFLEVLKTQVFLSKYALLR
ncbi:MAG: hypothetical protein V1787_00465 [Candidatus Micrarchaeota archaeon]